MSAILRALRNIPLPPIREWLARTLVFFHALAGGPRRQNQPPALEPPKQDESDEGSTDWGSFTDTVKRTGERRCLITWPDKQPEKKLKHAKFEVPWYRSSEFKEMEYAPPLGFWDKCRIYMRPTPKPRRLEFSDDDFDDDTWWEGREVMDEIAYQVYQNFTAENSAKTVKFSTSEGNKVVLNLVKPSSRTLKREITSTYKGACGCLLRYALEFAEVTKERSGPVATFGYYFLPCPCVEKEEDEEAAVFLGRPPVKATTSRACTRISDLETSPENASQNRSVATAGTSKGGKSVTEPKNQGKESEGKGKQGQPGKERGKMETGNRQNKKAEAEKTSEKDGEKKGDKKGRSPGRSSRPATTHKTGSETASERQDVGCQVNIPLEAATPGPSGRTRLRALAKASTSAAALAGSPGGPPLEWVRPRENNSDDDDDDQINDHSFKRRGGPKANTNKIPRLDLIRLSFILPMGGGVEALDVYPDDPFQVFAEHFAGILRVDPEMITFRILGRQVMLTATHKGLGYQPQIPIEMFLGESQPTRAPQFASVVLKYKEEPLCSVKIRLTATVSDLAIRAAQYFCPTADADELELELDGYILPHDNTIKKSLMYEGAIIKVADGTKKEEVPIIQDVEMEECG